MIDRKIFGCGGFQKSAQPKKISGCGGFLKSTQPKKTFGCGGFLSHKKMAVEKMKSHFGCGICPDRLLLTPKGHLGSKFDRQTSISSEILECQGGVTAPTPLRHQVGVKSLIIILVKRAYSESMPKSHDPFTIIPKLCESVGKEYYKIGLE